MRRYLAFFVLIPALLGMHGDNVGREVFHSTMTIAVAIDPPILVRRLEPLVSELKSTGFQVQLNVNDPKQLLFAESTEGTRDLPGSHTQSISIGLIEAGGQSAYRLEISATLRPAISKHPWAPTGRIATDLTSLQEKLITTMVENFVEKSK